MKRMKVFLIMFMFSIVTISIATLTAADVTGTIKLTFIRNNVSETPEKVMLWTWGGGTGGAKDGILPSSQDEKGTVFNFEVKVAADAEATIGVIPVIAKEDDTPNWDRKISYGGANLSLPTADVLGTGIKHALIYENAKDGEVAYSPLNPTGYLVSLTYFAASYEENLGVHSWGWVGDAPQWGTPAKIFTTVGRAADGTEIKGAILEAPTISSAGLLIYAGGDDTKKHPTHGDLKTENGDFEGAEVGVVYHVAVANDTVYDQDMSSFINDAFKFKFVGYSKDTNGYDTGTYATNKKNIIVKISADVVIAKTGEADKVLTTNERKALAGKLFSVHEKGNATNTIEVDYADFNQFAEAGVKDFVVVLKTELDNTKDYILTFDDKAAKQAEIEVNLDKKGPEITLIGVTNDLVKVAFGKKFDMKLFPRYKAMDDRDGDVTNKVYVPAGKGKLNTAVKGDYLVTLRVEDKWGNVTDKVITFRVE